MSVLYEETMSFVHLHEEYAAHFNYEESGNLMVQLQTFGLATKIYRRLGNIDRYQGSMTLKTETRFCHQLVAEGVTGVDDGLLEAFAEAFAERYFSSRDSSARDED